MTREEIEKMFLELNSVLVKFWKEQGRPDREIKIELLERMLHWYRNMGYATLDWQELDIPSDIEDEGYELAEKDLGWISVKDRLPEESGFYITCVEQSGVAQCVSVDNYFDVKRKEWIEDDEDNCIAAVDYWMPIPKLPKDV